MKKEREDALFEFIKEDDHAFMEKYLLKLTDEELTRFLDANPDFIDGLVSE